jgi:hypothetical protein
MASTIPLPYVPFAPGSSSLLDVPSPGVPVPFPHLPPPPSKFLFWYFAVLLFCLFLCFLSFFFAFFADLLRASFAALRPLLSFFHVPTAMSFHHALLCTGSTYTGLVSFLVFLFCLYLVMSLFFSLYFICYLLVIMFWPRWLDWIPFDFDLCVVDVYVTLAFRSRRKNGPDFYVVDEYVSCLNCRGG